MGLQKIRLGIEEIFTIRIQDETGREIEKWTFLKSDFARVIRILSSKFSINLWKKEDKDKQLDWAINN
jgi:hypothetical protein